MNKTLPKRTIGFFGATGISVGSIVGGGILALAGVAFAAAGPSAIIAFMLNGIVALITALSFAEMSAAFPESGGAPIPSPKRFFRFVPPLPLDGYSGLHRLWQEFYIPWVLISLPQWPEK